VEHETKVSTHEKKESLLNERVKTQEKQRMLVQKSSRGYQSIVEYIHRRTNQLASFMVFSENKSAVFDEEPQII